MSRQDLADLPAFLTVEQAAALVGISRSSAYECAARGELPTVRFGRRLRVPRAAVLRLAGEQLVSTPLEQATDQQEQEGGGTTDHATEEPHKS
jgi:excisionase family DNA binding protein